MSSPSARPSATASPIVAPTAHPPLIGFGIVLGAAALLIQRSASGPAAAGPVIVPGGP